MLRWLMMPRATVAGYGLALVAGAGLNAVHVPLAWILGPLLISAVLAIVGYNIDPPIFMRRLGQLAIGAAVGLNMTFAVLLQLIGWLPIMFVSALVMILISAVYSVLLGRLAGMVAYAGLLAALTSLDFTTAALATSPGGMSEMAATAQSLHLNVALIGTKFNVLPGYTGGGSEVLPALESGEIGGAARSWTAWSQRKDLFEDNIVAPVMVYGRGRSPGSLQELIELAKSQPGELTFGSSGAGTSPYLAMERLKQMAVIDMVHVPYKGSAPAVLGIVSGEVDLMFGAVSTTLPHVEEGALKAIAVSTTERIPNAPDIPTVDESGLSGFQAASWYGILAPAGTPDDTVARLNEGIVTVLKSEGMSARLAEMGFDLVANSPEEFAQILHDDIATWGEVIANIEQ